MTQPIRWQLTVATNIRGDKGNFALSLDENGLPQITVRETDVDLHSVGSNTLLPRKTWRRLVVTADGDRLGLPRTARGITATRHGRPVKNSTT